MPTIKVEFDERELRALARVTPAVRRAIRKAAQTALRDMRSEASKRIRQRKRIKARFVHRALVMRRVGDGEVVALDVRGDRVPLTAYPNRQSKKGVSVEVNRGKRTLIKSAFLATMPSGHRGVFIRRGIQRLPIEERFGSRPVDALLHKGEAEGVGTRGARSYQSAFGRLLKMELDKAGGTP